jgi:hypothetical protein
VKKRFRLFLIGFIIGIIVVIIAYGEKSKTMFDWTPEGRVLKRLKLTEKVVNDSMQCILDCNNFDQKHWEYMYLEGKVNFSRARTKPYPIYSVTIENDSIPLTKLTFLAKDSTSVLIDFSGANICDCQ